MYLAVVDTYYTTYAISDTREGARVAALTRAQEYLIRENLEGYDTLDDVENWLGCNIHELNKDQGIIAQ